MERERERGREGGRKRERGEGGRRIIHVSVFIRGAQ